MSDWMMSNLPGMLLSSVLESFVVTLVVYSLCAVFVLYKGMKGVRGWHLLAVFSCVLLLQGSLNLLVQIMLPSTDLLGAIALMRIIVSPAILSCLALLTLKYRARPDGD